MGLFSIFSKNKQESSAQDSGHFSRDDEFGQQARAKRASHANESGQGASRRSRSGGDPMLPEKKRARRRLVGAVALALAAAVGLPMLLDAEPRPLAGDIAIQIPSKDKAPALPMPSAPAGPIAAADSVDQNEEIIAAPPVAVPARTVPATSAPAGAASARPAPADAPLPRATAPVLPATVISDDDGPLRSDPDVKRVAEPHSAAHQATPKASPEARAERKGADKAADKAMDKAADKPAEKPVKKAEDKPAAPPAREREAARALALLEGKQAERAAPADKADGQRFVVQVAALATQEKVDELQARLRAAGIASFTQKSGALIRVRTGPFGSREEADRAKGRLGALGLGGTLVPL